MEKKKTHNKLMYWLIIRVTVQYECTIIPITVLIHWCSDLLEAVKLEIN